jgi:hypothetical protein
MLDITRSIEETELSALAAYDARIPRQIVSGDSCRCLCWSVAEVPIENPELT